MPLSRTTLRTTARSPSASAGVRESTKSSPAGVIQLAQSKSTAQESGAGGGDTASTRTARCSSSRNLRSQPGMERLCKRMESTAAAGGKLSWSVMPCRPSRGTSKPHLQVRRSPSGVRAKSPSKQDQPCSNQLMLLTTCQCPSSSGKSSGPAVRFQSRRWRASAGDPRPPQDSPAAAKPRSAAAAEAARRQRAMATHAPSAR
mmetsp:Transcript_137158/g.426229  ORF Transcript_137158/g.426229 Transcript_137158/m.426229 type:complete len:202 (+) Transcript_137158:111-716(+)